MKLSTLLARCNRKVLVMVATGAALTQISFAGCDTALRDNLLIGIEAGLITIVNTFINAFFQSLLTPGSTSQPVVQAVLDFLPTLV